MAERFDLNTINQFVLNKQYLGGSSKNAPLDQIVQDVGGLHATSAMTPYLSLAARRPEFKPEELDRHLYEEPDMIRLRCVRKTIYVQGEMVIPVFFAATTQKLVKASEHFMVYRGVPLREYKVLADSIMSLLQKQQLTATEIKEALDTNFDISSVLYFMCDQGLLARGAPKAGWKDRRYRYAPFEQLFPNVDLGALEEKEAIPILIRHYLRAFGPASLNDIIWWTGLGKIRVRSAVRSLGDELIDVEMAETNATLLMLASEIDLLRSTTANPNPVVNILPNLDSYLMGYIDRGRYVNNAYYDYIFDNSGNVTNVILLNGRAAGVWDYSLEEESTVKLYLFDYQLAGAGDVIRAMVRRIGQIVAGKDVRVHQIERMVPLVKQPAGAMMAPLKGL